MKNVTELVLDMKHDLLELWVSGKLWVLGFSVGAFLNFIKVFIFADIRYLIWLLVVIVLDIGAKLYDIWFTKKEKPDFSELINKLLNKTMKYSLYLIASHVLINFEVGGESFGFLKAFNPFVYGVLIIKEVDSIMKNLGMKLPKQLTNIINEKFDLKDGKES